MIDPTQKLEELFKQDLSELEALFSQAMDARHAGDAAKCAELLRQIIKVEPRLAEPHLELGRIHLDADEYDDAEVESREALRFLTQGGQWVDDLNENQLLSIAHGQLGEVLRLQASQDAVIFGDPEAFKAIVKEAQHHASLSLDLDPDQEKPGFYEFALQKSKD